MMIAILATLYAIGGAVTFGFFIQLFVRLNAEMHVGRAFVAALLWPLFWIAIMAPVLGKLRRP